MAVIARKLSGPYAWTYGGNPLGVIEDAVVARFVTSEEVVVGDNLGDTIQAMINRGHNAYLDFVFQESELPAVLDAIWPYANLAGANDIVPGKMGAVNEPSVGQVRSAAQGGTAVLQGIRVVGNQAAAFPGNTSTAPYRIHAGAGTLAPNQNFAQLFGSRGRPTAISFLCMPFVAASGITYTLTGADDPL